MELTVAVSLLTLAFLTIIRKNKKYLRKLASLANIGNRLAQQQADVRLLTRLKSRLLKITKNSQPLAIWIQRSVVGGNDKWKVNKVASVGSQVHYYQG